MIASFAIFFFTNHTNHMELEQSKIVPYQLSYDVSFWSFLPRNNYTYDMELEKSQVIPYQQSRLCKYQISLRLSLKEFEFRF